MIDCTVVNLIYSTFIIFMVISELFLTGKDHWLLAKLASSVGRYGKLSKSSANGLLSFLEVPKSWFRGFYTAAAVFASIGLFLIYRVYIVNEDIPDAVFSALDFLHGKDRRAEVHPMKTTIAMVLMASHIYRRCLETNFIQIFSSKARMNIFVPVFGVFYYFVVCTNILAASHGFVRGSEVLTMEWTVTDNDLMFSALFIYAWYAQFQSNLILAHLRMNKEGAIVTEKHAIPYGGYFDWVSAPHMLFEILVYVALYGLIRTQTVLLLAVFVVANQVPTALATHTWYKEKFKEYPAERKAIIPFML